MMHETKQQSPRDDGFTRSSLTWQASLLRLALLYGKMIPNECSKWLTSSAFQSILVDPAFSVQTFREASAIRRLFPPHRFADAYQGFRIPVPPLFLTAIEPLLSLSEDASAIWITGIILLVVDCCIAWNLEQIGRALIQRASREEYLELKMPERICAPLAHVFGIGRSSEASKQVFTTDSLPLAIAHLYYLSPVSVLCGSLLHCFQNVPVLCLVMAIRHATCIQSGTLVWSSLWLAVASYVSLHNILFAIPIALLFRRKSGRSMVLFLVMFVSLSISLQVLNILLVGQQDYWSIFLSTHLATFKLSNLAPSLSTLWYLGMVLFERFSRYLTFALTGLPYVVVAPTVIRLHGYPEALIAIFWLLGTLFRPPSTLFKLNIGFCLLLLSPRSLARVRFTPSLVALCALPVPISLYLVNHWLWLETNIGEANFVFFQCLAYNVFVAIIFIQFCSATLKRDKALRLTEKVAD